MKGLAKALVAALVVIVAVLAASARADTPPNAWDLAKNPRAREDWALHVMVREMLSIEGQPELRPLVSATLDRARALLEEAGAATSSDVRLRFDLGEVYQHQQDHARAVAVLKPALEMAPTHPAAAGAFLSLAYAYAYLDKPQDERQAYEQYLARETNPWARATAILNLGEARMRLGHVEDAIADFQETLAIAATLPPVYGQSDAILAVWDLAVALDRAGDPAGAEVQARRATQMDPNERMISSDPKVFFVPAYERYWYVALGKAEDAKQASNARMAARLWAQAEQIWRRYVAEAGAHERWLPLARAHLERAHASRVAAEKRAAKERPLPRTDELVE